jgi:uncharacterized protein YjiK
MATLPKSRPSFWWLLLLLPLLLAGWALQEFRLFERAWFNWREDQHASQWQERSLWLPGYRVQLEAQPIVGLEAEVSALTYDPDRHSLFTVTNKNPEIIELSLDGQMLRRIALRGFGDPEAIEYIGPGRYVISDEREQRLIKVQLEDDTTEVDASQGQQLSLGIGLSGNKGFEGLAFDAERQRLFVAKERDPVRIYEIHGFPHLAPDKPMSVQVVDNIKRDARLFVRDLSSLDFDAVTGHLLVLSDESQLILELNAAGKPISSLSLRKGSHGLQASVPQAEGLATDGAGNLYLVSEPNLFYKFSKAPVPER